MIGPPRAPTSGRWSLCTLCHRNLAAWWGRRRPCVEPTRARNARLHQRDRRRCQTTPARYAGPASAVWSGRVFQHVELDIQKPSREDPGPATLVGIGIAVGDPADEPVRQGGREDDIGHAATEPRARREGKFSLASEIVKA